MSTYSIARRVALRYSAKWYEEPSGEDPRHILKRLQEDLKRYPGKEFDWKLALRGTDLSAHIDADMYQVHATVEDLGRVFSGVTLQVKYIELGPPLVERKIKTFVPHYDYLEMSLRSAERMLGRVLDTADLAKTKNLNFQLVGDM